MRLIDRLFSARQTEPVSRFPGRGTLVNAMTQAGVRVDTGGAMTLSAYYGAIRAISEDIAKLPLKVFERLERGKREAPDHPLWPILHDAPNADMTAMAFRETLMHHAVGWGNGYAEIERNRRNDPIGLHIIHPSRVEIGRTQQGRLVYRIHNNDLTSTDLPSEDVLHIHGLGSDGIQGYTPAELAARSLGASIQADSFASSFYKNGASVSGVLMIPKWEDEKTRQRARESWDRQYAGSENAGKTAFLPKDSDYKQIGIPPEQAQFLETRNFNIEEIARWFRIPPVVIGHNTSTPYTNVESLQRIKVDDTLTPWAVRVEQEIARKLFRRDNRFFAEHIFAGLLRGDMQSRASFYRELFQLAAITPNEIRAKENMNPYDGGDSHFVMTNMASPDAVANGEVEQAETAGSEIESTAEPVDYESSKRAMMPVFVDAAEQVMRKETADIKRGATKCASQGSDFEQWLDRFYENHHQFVAEKMGKPSESLARVVGYEMPESRVAEVMGAYASEHNGDSKKQLMAAWEDSEVEALCDEWKRERPAWIAEHLTDRVVKEMKDE